MCCHGCIGMTRRYLTEERLPEIITDAAVVIAKIGGLTIPESPCGAFCLLDTETGELLISPVLVGKIFNRQEQKYLELCLEKAQRLLQMFKEHGHLLSWQSRDPENGKWGGAIYDGRYIWSFSGLPEAGDEASMLLLARRSGQLTWGHAEHMAGISNNSVLTREMFFDPFWEN